MSVPLVHSTTSKEQLPFQSNRKLWFPRLASKFTRGIDITRDLLFPGARLNVRFDVVRQHLPPFWFTVFSLCNPFAEVAVKSARRCNKRSRHLVPFALLAFAAGRKFVRLTLIIFSPEPRPRDSAARPQWLFDVGNSSRYSLAKFDKKAEYIE